MILGYKEPRHLEKVFSQKVVYLNTSFEARVLWPRLLHTIGGSLSAPLVFNYSEPTLVSVAAHLSCRFFFAIISTAMFIVKLSMSQQQMSAVSF